MAARLLNGVRDFQVACATSKPTNIRSKKYERDVQDTQRQMRRCAPRATPGAGRCAAGAADGASRRQPRHTPRISGRFCGEASYVLGAARRFAMPHHLPQVPYPSPLPGCKSWPGPSPFTPKQSSRHPPSGRQGFEPQLPSI